jgi:hypothetical protein
MSAVPSTPADRGTALREEQLLAVLEPVARLARSNGFSSSDLLRLFRESILAATEASSTSESPSVARLSIESGLNRSDVQSLLAGRDVRRAQVLAERRLKQIASRVVTEWTTNPRTSAPYGCALPLRVSRANSVTPADSDRLTFAELVQAVEPSANSTDVLAALVDSGTATWESEANDVVALLPEFASVLEQGDDATFWYVTSTLAGIARTLGTNAYGLYPGPKLFERRAVADRFVDQAALVNLNERVVSRLSTALESITTELDKAEPEDFVAAENGPAFRACIGMYVMAEEGDRPLPGTTPKRRAVQTIDLASPNALVSDDD